MKIKIFLISLLLFFTGCSGGGQRAVYKAKPAFYAYIISDVKDGKIHEEYASEVYATPASCQKTITAILALKYLGPEYIYETKLFAKDQNDIVISFSGDPTLTSADLMKLLTPLKNKQIEGRILLDASIFTTQEYSPNLMIYEMGLGYSTPVYSINIDRNLLSPKTSPKEMHPFIISKVQKVLDSLNIKGKIEIVSDKKKLPSRLKLLGKIDSKPLKEILPPALKISDNLVFDSLYLTIIHRHKPFGIKDWSEGDPIFKKLLRNYYPDLDVTDAIFVDGSGLSRHNRIQPKQLLQILRHGYEINEFVQSLAKPGEENSTLAKRSDLPNNIIAKTGSMMGVSCLCGYSLEQTPKAFVIMTNSFGPMDKDLLEVTDKFIKNKL